MSEFKWQDIVMTTKDVYSSIDDYTLPAFSFGSVVCQVPDSSIVLADFEEAGIRTMDAHDIIKM